MPDDTTERAAELRDIRRRLADYYDPAETETWLNAPHLLLVNERPMDLINSGQGARVTRLLDQLDSGAFI